MPCLRAKVDSRAMREVCKLIDSILLVFFCFIAVVAPLLDGQTCLPRSFFPDVLVYLKQWYAREYSDFLVADKPHFFVALVWFELLFQWPLAILNVYAILASRSWFPTTCLLYGVSVSTAMVAILGELVGSEKSSHKLMMVYSPFLVLGVLATLRGLASCSAKTASTFGKQLAVPVAREKKA